MGGIETDWGWDIGDLYDDTLELNALIVPAPDEPAEEGEDAV